MADPESLVYPTVEIDKMRRAVYVYVPESGDTQVLFPEGDLHEIASTIGKTAVSTDICI